MATTGNVISFRPALEPNTSSPDDRSMPFRGGGDSAPVFTPAPARSSDLATLQDLGNGLVFVHPLFIRLEQQSDVWNAISADLNLIGEGESDLDAIDDLRGQIADLYESLIEMRSSLGARPAMQLAFLDRLAGNAR